MSTDTQKHEAMFNYIVQCPLVSEAYFNIQNADEEQAVSFVPIYSDVAKKRYIDGSAEKEYSFAIVIYKPLSDVPYSNENIETLQTVQSFMTWIDTQNAIKNFPDFGENCEVSAIENTQNMPNLAGVDEKNKAKYIFQCKVTYLEKRRF